MKLKAGRYWIGDPCYVLGNNAPGDNFNWKEFCDFIFKDDPTGREQEGVVEHQGIRFAFFGTAYGDGCYQDQHGNEYGVDAGMIGCIPEEFVFDKKEAKRLGTFHDFKTSFDCSYEDGTIRFGNVTIPTGDEEDDYEEDDY